MPRLDRDSIIQGDCGMSWLVLEKILGRCIRAVLLGLVGTGGEGAGGKYDNFPKGTDQDGLQLIALFIQ